MIVYMTEVKVIFEIFWPRSDLKGIFALRSPYCKESKCHEHTGLPERCVKSGPVKETQDF